MSKSLMLHGRAVSRDGAPFVMAEIGVNHDGDVGVARQLIDAAAAAGADAVKFQLFSSKLLLAREAGLVAYQRAAAESAQELLSPLELTPEQLAPLVAHAHGAGLAALITPFSPTLVQAAVGCGADGIKLASPDLVNLPLVEAAVGTGLPLVLSTGAATLEEVGQAVGWLGAAAARTVLLHCVSSYPTAAGDATLGAIRVLRTRWPQMAVGYSDHTVETVTGALAVASGACVLEKHLTLDRTRRGPDHAASLEPAALAEYVAAARQAYAMVGAMEKRVLEIEREVRAQTRQSVAAACDLAAGTVLGRGHLTVMRPGTGIPAAGLGDLIGRTVRRAVAAGTLLSMSDLQES